MKKSIFLRWAAYSGFLLLALTGCRSDQYYQASAADEAREFLLKNSPELTADQICFVRYNDPVLLTGEGVGDPNVMGSAQTSSAYIRQICAAWEIPGRDEIYLVCGFSDERMQFWSPNRLIRKKFNKQAQAQDAMLSQARTYFLSNLAAELTTAEINHVRFTYPFLIESNFEINFRTDMTKDEDFVAKQKAGAAKMRQYSLVWEIGDRRVVFSGYSSEDLEGWHLQFAGILRPAEVTEHTLFRVKTPADFNTRLIKAIEATK